MNLADSIIYVAELIGTAAFAVSGSIAAADHRLDVFGVIVVGTTTALGGGVLRDIILNISPPVMFDRYIYSLISLLFCMIVFFYARDMKKKGTDGLHNKYLRILNIFDSMGLGVFAIVGTNTVISMPEYAENAFLAIFVGTVSSVGGGMIRDIMLGEIPVILMKRIYAVAALLGSVLYYILYFVGLDMSAAALIGIASIVIIRVLSIRFNWNLPTT